MFERIVLENDFSKRWCLEGVRRNQTIRALATMVAMSNMGCETFAYENNTTTAIRSLMVMGVMEGGMDEFEAEEVVEAEIGSFVRDIELGDVYIIARGFELLRTYSIIR